MSKIHLIDSPEPIQAGGTLKANCGKEIPRATIAFMWDEQEMGHHDLRLAGTCKTCCRAA